MFTSSDLLRYVNAQSLFVYIYIDSVYIYLYCLHQLHQVNFLVSANLLGNKLDSDSDSDYLLLLSNVPVVFVLSWCFVKCFWFCVLSCCLFFFFSFLLRSEIFSCLLKWFLKYRVCWFKKNKNTLGVFSGFIVLGVFLSAAVLFTLRANIGRDEREENWHLHT